MSSACRELDGFQTEQIVRPGHRVRNTHFRHLEKFLRLTAGHGPPNDYMPSSLKLFSKNQEKNLRFKASNPLYLLRNVKRFT